MKKEILFLVSIMIFFNLVMISIYFLGQNSKSGITGNIISGIKETKTEKGFVTKIIDGDTIIVNGESVRLLGIDCDEKGYPCYDAAKKRIEELVLNKEVVLRKEGDDRDKYGRLLRYIFLKNTNINLELVKEGLAVARVSNDKYKDEILDAENFARENKIGCKWKNLKNYNYNLRNKNSFGEESKNLDKKEQNNKNKQKTKPERINKKPKNWVCYAGNFIGKEKTLVGFVKSVYKSKKGNIFLNFEYKYPNQCFTGVIFSYDSKKFEDYKNYKNKNVEITGKIKEYKGKPEIILKNKEQLRIIN